MPPIDCAGDDLLVFMEEEADFIEQDAPHDDLDHMLICDDLVDEQEPPTEMIED